jgi:hypothetical protein
MGSSDITPFKGRSELAAAPLTVLHRFTKPGGRVAVICERKVSPGRAIEFLVYVDHDLRESQVFYGSRVAQYPAALAAVIAQYVDDGWIEQPARSNTMQ